MVIAEGVEGKADHGRVDVDVIGDKLHFRAPLQRRNDGAGLPVGDAGHGVVQVGHVGRTGVKGREGGIVAGAGVGDGDAHFLVALLDEVQRARLLRGNIHQLDQAARPLLQAAEHPHIGGVEVLRVLGAHLLRADEGAFHVAAHKVRALAVFVGGGGIHDVVQDLFREGHSRGADGQHAFAGLEVSEGLDGFFAAVAEVLAHRPVEVDIHQTRQGIGPGRVHDFLALFGLGERHDAAIADEEVPLLKGVAGGIDFCVLDDHMLVPLRNNSLSHGFAVPAPSVREP